MKSTIQVKPIRFAAVGIAILTLAGCAQGTSSSTSSSAAPASTGAQSQSSAPTGAQSQSSAPATAGSSSGGAKSAGQPSKPNGVILIGDQAFGDHGPMDDMAAALAGCQANQKFDTKKVAVLSPADYQSTVSGAATQGYGLIITTFPQMTNATTSVAAANPNTKFAAVYQDINDQKSAPVSNIWSSSFDITGSSFIEGAVATTLSKSKKIGMIVGDMDPTIAGGLNAYIQGAKHVDPAAQVIWANANSFGDPAKGKDLAQGMIAKGVDVIATNAAQTQLGALDAAKSAGILFFGDNGDNSATYPKGFVSDSRSELGKAVTEACESYKAGTFQGGKHTVYNVTNGGADLDLKLISKWGQASGDESAATNVESLYKKLTDDITNGSIKVANNPNPPAA